MHNNQNLLQIKAFFAIALLWICLPSMAESDEYEIIYIHNYKYLTVNDKKLQVGDQFEDNQEIKWEPRQFVRVKKAGSGKEQVYTLTQLGFAENRSKTLADYLLNEKTLYSRGMAEGSNYNNKRYYLADSVHIPTLSAPNNDYVAESVWRISDDESVIVRLDKTDDGKYYIITPSIFGDKEPEDIKIDIRERAMSFDWTDNVYQNLSIYYIP